MALQTNRTPGSEKAHRGVGSPTQRSTGSGCVHFVTSSHTFMKKKNKIATEKKVKGQRHSVEEDNHIRGLMFKVVNIQRKVNEKRED